MADFKLKEKEILIEKDFAILKDGKPKFYSKGISYEEIAKIIKNNIETDLQVHLIKSSYGPNWDYIPIFDLILKSNEYEIIWIPSFVSLTGSYVYGKAEPRDLDIVLRMGDNLEPDSAILCKLTRLGFEIDDLSFDLELKEAHSEKITVNDSPKVQEIIKANIFRVNNKDLEDQALASKKEDKILPYRMIIPGKPELSAVNAYRSGETFKFDTLLEEVLKYSQNRGEAFTPMIVQMKVDGARHLIFKHKKDIKVYSEDGTDNTAKFPDLVEYLSKIDNDLVLDSEIELFKGKEHQPREILSGAIHSKEPLGKDYHFVYNIFDCLYLDKDLHKLPYIERLESLEKAKIFKESEDANRYKTTINFLKTYIARNPQQLKRICEQILEIKDSEGVMVKPSDSIYPLNGRAPWWKLKKYAEAHCLVYDKKKTKSGAYNLYVAVYYDGSMEIPEKNLIKYKDKYYVPVAVTYNTAVDIPIGSIVTVSFHNLNIYQDEGRVKLYEPKFIEVLDTLDEPDSLATLIEIGNEAGIEVRKDYWLPLWVNEDETYHYMIHRHFRGKSVSDRTPIHVLYKGVYNIVPIYSLIPAHIKENEYVPEDCYVWTSKGWSKVIKVTRHPLTSPLYTLKTKSVIIEVTGDHSIFSNGKPIEVKNCSRNVQIDLLSLPEIEHNLMVDEDICVLLAKVIKNGQKTDGGLISLPLSDEDSIKKVREKYGLFTVYSEDQIGITGMGLLFSCFAGRQNTVKRIPPQVFRWNLESIKVFLEILKIKDKVFEADNMQLGEGLIYLGSLVYGDQFRLDLTNNTVIIDFNGQRSNKVTAVTEKTDSISNFLKYPKSRFVYDIETENQEFAGGLGLVKFHNSSHLDLRMEVNA